MIEIHFGSAKTSFKSPSDGTMTTSWVCQGASRPSFAHQHRDRPAQQDTVFLFHNKRFLQSHLTLGASLGASRQNKTKKPHLKWQHPSNTSQPSVSECSCQCENNADASSLHPTGNYSAQSLKLELYFAINKSSVIPLVCVGVEQSQVINEKWHLIQMIDAPFKAGLMAF